MHPGPTIAFIELCPQFILAAVSFSHMPSGKFFPPHPCVPLSPFLSPSTQGAFALPRHLVLAVQCCMVSHRRAFTAWKLNNTTSRTEKGRNQDEEVGQRAGIVEEEAVGSQGRGWGSGERDERKT